MKRFFIFVSVFISVYGKPSRIVRDSGNGEMSQCKDGSIFTMNHLKWKCNKGFPEPLACLGSDRIKNQEIPINSTKTIDGYWYKCQTIGDRINYQEEPRCLFNGKPYHMNETIKDANLIYECKSTGLIPKGCFFTDSKGKEITIKSGESATIDGVLHQCGVVSGQGKGNNSNPTSTESTGCVHEGNTHKSGEKWKGKKDFMFICTSEGRINITDCVIDANLGGGTVAVGQTLVKGDYFHKCTREGNSVGYSAEPCKVMIQCEGANIGQPVSGSQVHQVSGDTEKQPTVVAGGEKVVGGGNENPKQCTKNGKAHQLNEAWSENGFKYICQSNGRVNFTACVADDGTEIPIGQTVVKNSLQHKCVFKPPGGIVYEALVCGSQADCGQGLTGMSSNAKANFTVNGDEPKKC